MLFTCSIVGPVAKNSSEKRQVVLYLNFLRQYRWMMVEAADVGSMVDLIRVGTSVASVIITSVEAMQALYLGTCVLLRGLAARFPIFGLMRVWSAAEYIIF